jgi:hypothetical protein
MEHSRSWRWTTRPLPSAIIDVDGVVAEGALGLAAGVF